MVRYVAQSTVPSNCGVAEVVCAPIEMPLFCNVHQFGWCALFRFYKILIASKVKIDVPSDMPCYYSHSESSCSDQCSQVGVATLCKCPVDRTGSKCDQFVRFQ